MPAFTLAAFADEADNQLCGQIEALRQAGITCLEIRGVNGQNVADLTPAQAKEIRRKLDDNGITVTAIGSPIGKIQITDPLQPELDRLARVTQTATILGAGFIRMFSFYIPEGESPAAYRSEVMDRLDSFCQVVQGSGVALGHENEAKIYGESIENCLDIATTFAGRIGTVLDPSNYCLAGYSPLQAFEALKDSILWMHIKDGRNGRVVPPGEGDAQLAQLLQAKLAYSGPCVLTLEPHLSDFVGLASQHQGRDTSHMVGDIRFANNRESFAYAAAALKRLLP